MSAPGTLAKVAPSPASTPTFAPAKSGVGVSHSSVSSHTTAKARPSPPVPTAAWNVLRAPGSVVESAKPPTPHHVATKSATGANGDCAGNVAATSAAMRAAVAGRGGASTRKYTRFASGAPGTGTGPSVVTTSAQNAATSGGSATVGNADVEYRQAPSHPNMT